jgi:hypothetical protein
MYCFTFVTIPVRAKAMMIQFGISPTYWQQLVFEADLAAMVAAEARKVLLLESAKHVKMARVQRLLYQQKIAASVMDALTPLLWTMDKTWSCPFIIISSPAARITSIR